MSEQTPCQHAWVTARGIRHCHKCEVNYEEHLEAEIAALRAEVSRLGGMLAVTEYAFKFETEQKEARYDENARLTAQIAAMQQGRKTDLEVIQDLLALLGDIELLPDDETHAFARGKAAFDYACALSAALSQPTKPQELPPPVWFHIHPERKDVGTWSCTEEEARATQAALRDGWQTWLYRPYQQLQPQEVDKA